MLCFIIKLCVLLSSFLQITMSVTMGVLGKTNLAVAAFTRRKFSTSVAMKACIKNVVVFGGGLMGSGIAQVD